MIISKEDIRSLPLIRRLLTEYIYPYKNKILLAILCMVLVAATSAIHAWMIKPALDEIFFKTNKDMLAAIPLAIVIIAFVKAISAYFQNYLLKSVGQRVITDIQSNLYAHLVNADLEYIQKYSSGKIISRFTNDINIVRRSLASFLTGIAKELLTVIFLIGVMFTLDLTLALITFIVFPLAILPIVRMGRKMRKISHSTQEELGEYTSTLDDTFQTIRIVKSYRGEEFEIKKASHILNNILGFYIKAIRIEALSSPIMEMLSGIAIALVIWYGGMQVINGYTSPGSFFAFITAFIAAYKPVKSLAELNNNLQEGLSAITRLFKVLDEEPRVKNYKEALPLKIKNAHIQLENISFKYSDKKLALQNLSLDIPGGKVIALVGNSGGGKSTIINLLMRFYNADMGRILIDGQDITKSTIESLRDGISLVTQDVLLFDATVKENIAYGKAGATEDEIINAARLAFAHNFIEELPEGYDTKIGQKGFKLSGGQKQRLSIARAILKDSPILILDEATSALDNISEQEIQNSLKKIRKNKTTIIIAHRLSTIINADIIYVINRGRLVESGKHNELVTLNGEYKKLYEADTR